MLGVALMLVMTAEPVKLASTGFTCTGISEALCAGYAERFVGVLSSGPNVRVTTQRDIAAVLGIERQKQLLGCSDDGSACMTELAAALGVDGILLGSITPTPNGYLVNIRIVHANDASAWLMKSDRVRSERALQESLDVTAEELYRSLAPSRAARVIPFVLLGAGAVAAIAGGICFGLSKADAATLKSTAPLTDAEVMSTASRGGTLQPVGVTLLSVGLVVLAAGLIWWLAGSAP
ncbi:MAG: hypothetical protein JNK82_14300 [Myxococcaceae bacterium]|nr:hypothetical protein [Myxococcaceae bacterium]